MTTTAVRHASKKASTPVSLASKLCSFNNFTEAEFDEPINYGLLYAEENSIIEEVAHFDYLAGSSDQETTYYTEGTPLETPLHFSTATSTSDLLKLDDIRITYAPLGETRKLITSDQATQIIKEKLGNSREIGHLKGYMEFDNKDKECEDTDVEIYLPDDLDDFDEKCDEERLEKIINVTPSQSPIELCEKDRDGKMVTFKGDERYSQLTPLMFSRCSSLGSLSGYEQQSLHDDRSSVVSDFSRRTSEAVSPSELPDSPARFMPGTSQKDRKLSRKKVQSRDKIQSFEPCSLQQEVSKRSIFEDDLAVFKEESTPIKFQSVAASSLSSLTIDDDEDEERGEVKNKAGVIKTLKMNVATEQDNNPNEPEKEKATNAERFEENSYFSVDEEEILDEYIRKGIAKVTRQNINDVSSFNLQTGKTYESDETDPEKSCNMACNSSLEFFDENSDLTAEEEKLLDECIRRGIAKVTRQNINDVTSLSLCSNFSKLSTLGSRDKSDGKENQEQETEESQKQTAVCQTEQTNVEHF